MTRYNKFPLEVPTFKFALTEGLPDLYLPTKGSERATGWDVRSTQDLVIKPGEYVKIPLGFRALPPEGWWLELRPRSSTFAKKHLHALYGVIDEDYEGQCLFACQLSPNKIPLAEGGFLSENSVEIKAGEAIGQIIPVLRQEMEVVKLSNEELDREYQKRNTSRGAGGFGSTG